MSFLAQLASSFNDVIFCLHQERLASLWTKTAHYETSFITLVVSYNPWKLIFFLIRGPESVQHAEKFDKV
jgi:hypothetical protein